MATIVKRVRERSGKEPLVTWQAWYTDQNGRRRNKTFAKQKDARAWLDRTVIEVADGVHTPSSDSITVAEAGELWITQGRTDGLEPSTVAQYRSHLDLHIKPFIGRVKLAELKPAHLQSLRDRLIEAGRSRGMVKRVVISLGAILAAAMSYGKLARNIVRDQARNRSRREQRVAGRHDKRLEVGVDIPTKDEIRAMLNAAQPPYRALIVTVIFTGLRSSELRGLTWRDIDFAAETLTVRQRADRWNTIGSPKSEAGRRTVPLAPIVVNTLKEWKLACPKGKADLVFPTRQGNVVNVTTLTRTALGPLQLAAGITSSAAIRGQQPELTERGAVRFAYRHPSMGTTHCATPLPACSSRKAGTRRRYRRSSGTALSR
jgi:integrase